MIDLSIILQNIYTQKAVLEQHNLLPYYLLISKVVYDSMKTAMLTSDEMKIFMNNGNIELFENMEIVVFHDSPEDYIEIKGIMV